MTISKRQQLYIGLGLGALLMIVAGLLLVREKKAPIDEAIGAPTTQTGNSRYPWHSVVGTVFWVGEEETIDNAFITNVETAWDKKAVDSFGGVDDPDQRSPDGIKPAAFEPKHNTFYMALPAAEFTKDGPVAGAREKSYWRDEKIGSRASMFKGRWAEVYYRGKTAYVQWVDVGPFEEFDYGYVFGRNKPKNTFGKGAGIDLSPAAEWYLGFDGVADVFWRFVDADRVPEGPWKKYPAINNQTRW